MEDVTVTLKLPKSVYEFACFSAERAEMDIEIYLMQGIKDLIIGELVYRVDLMNTNRPNSEEDREALECLEEHVAIHSSGRRITELSTAPQVAALLGMRDFLVQPHHSSGWDDNALDIPI
ncbi:MAG: hypothetical protein JRN58_09850 [Nitrososphaerota archaeon]|nr:hypothetical protein [Nitrososphaerota archaeon]MDG6979369.1 hypothetical protein [Nitrososphaerota archaeon]